MKLSPMSRIQYIRSLLFISLCFTAMMISRDELFTPKEYHKYLLENSRFKSTKNLSRSERKSKGMPPNSYNERFHELTQNPYLGYPTTQKKFDLQNSLLNSKIRGGALSGKVPGQDSTNNWVSVGPNNVGGRTRGALFDLNDPQRDRVLAGGVSGGLWVNEDIDSPTNSEWSMVTGVPGNLAISVIVQDPNNPNIMYAGTGESYTNSDAMGNGIYKSTDSGNNWTRVAHVDFSSTVYSNQIFVDGGFFINDIQIWDPTPENSENSDEVVFAIFGGSASSDGELPEFYDDSYYGLWKSNDAGNTWSYVALPKNSNNRDDDLNDIEVDLENNIWISSTRSFYGDPGGNFYTSSDGASFSKITPTYPSIDNSKIERVEFTPSSTDTNTFYVLLNSNDYSQGEPGAEIFKTTDSFTTLTKLSEPVDADRGIPSYDFTRNQAFYDLEIEVDPNDGDIVYVGGIDWFRSSDGGSNWTQITKWSNNPNLNTLDCSIVHADQHGLYFHPDDSDKGIVVNDGGVYYAKSLSSASTSSTAFVSQESGFITTQFYRVAQMPLGVSSDNDLIIGGTQDNGTLIINNTDFSGPSSSYEFMGGDGGYTYIDQVGADYLIANYTYNNSLLLFNLKGLDLGGGNNYKYLSDDTDGDTSDDNEGDFINPGGLDSNLDILYVNGSLGGNYKIRRFFDLDTDSPYDSYITGLHSSPTAFKVSPFNTTSSTLFVGYDDGVLQKLENANTGSVVATNLADFIGSVSDIEFGSTEQEIFVTYYNYGVNNIYYSDDGGSTWSAKDGNLPDVPVLSILANPFEANEVIIGTDLGVWMTENFSVASPTWEQSNNGMTDVRVNDFQFRGSTVSNNRVVASTYGRGIFVGSFTGDTNGLNVVLSDTDDDDVVSNSDVVTITATFSESMAATPTLSLTGIASEVQMRSTSSDTVWTYAWTVSTTATSTTATVSGTDLAGNPYVGTESLTFIIDNSNPTLTIFKPTGTYTNQSVVVTLTYDEAVTGLSTDTSQFSEAINIASLTLLSASSDYTTYTVRITPSTDGLVKLTHAPNSPPVIDIAGNPIASTVSCSFIYDTTSPSVTLTDTDSDNVVSNSDVVTITAIFSESMAATPTLSLTGITSDVQMLATSSDTVWTYAWTVSTSVTSTTATVSGTDLAGNPYEGTESLTFIIDNTPPTVLLTQSHPDTIVSNSEVVTITATFDESMAATPTLSLTGVVSDVVMTATASDSIWIYTWTVSTSVTSTTATVSGTDLNGNPYVGSASRTFTIDNNAPAI
ncbi:MAG: hypothetical protein ACO3M9_06300, partial [Flavobacteriaceae bacterium]